MQELLRKRSVFSISFDMSFVLDYEYDMRCLYGMLRLNFQLTFSTANADEINIDTIDKDPENQDPKVS